MAAVAQSVARITLHIENNVKLLMSLSRLTRQSQENLQLQLLAAMDYHPTLQLSLYVQHTHCTCTPTISLHFKNINVNTYLKQH